MFSELEELVKIHFAPSRIFTAEETEVSCFYVNSEVLSLRRKKEVGKLTSGENGRNVTSVFCATVTGRFVPFVFVSPRAKINRRLVLKGPPEPVAVAKNK
jgi:hypothetical protein